MTTSDLIRKIEDKTETSIELYKVHLDEKSQVYSVEFIAHGRLQKCRVFNDTGEVVLQSSTRPFCWILEEGPCEVEVFNLNNNTGKNLSKTYSFIGNNTRSAIDTALRNSWISKNKGFAKNLDSSIEPYIDSIICLGMGKGESKEDSEEQFKPMLRFRIEGSLPEEMPMDVFLSKLERSMLEESRDGWGEDFKHKAVKRELRRNQNFTTSNVETYLVPWTSQSAVYFADIHE